MRLKSVRKLLYKNNRFNYVENVNGKAILYTYTQIQQTNYTHMVTLSFLTKESETIHFYEQVYFQGRIYGVDERDRTPPRWQNK